MRILVVSTLMASSFLTGCFQTADTSDLKQFVSKVLSTPRGRVEPIPEFKPYEYFSYSASAMRSPFGQPVVEDSEVMLNANMGNVRPDMDRAREYLEQFAIGELAMVGTLQKPNGDLWALIRDGSGGVVRVREGEYMGQNHGRIVSIADNRINLIEIVPNGMGGWIERPRTLALDGLAGE